MSYRAPFIAIIVLAALAATQMVSPELFAEGVVSTPDFDLNAVFLPDGKTVYFTRSTANMGFWMILSSRLVNGKWTEPEVAPFSGRYSDADPWVTADGARILFISRRSVHGRAGRPVPHIWYVDRTATGWSEPRNATALNSDGGEYYPSAAADGTIYFESARPGGKGRADVYRSRLVNGEYAAPEHLPAPLNSEFNEGDATIAPDQSFIIVTINGRADDTGMGDLYLSEQKDGVWTAPRPLPPGINSTALEFCPSLSPDGKWLYFTSTRGFGVEPLDRPLRYDELNSRLRGVMNGLGNVYRVPMSTVRPAPAE